MTLGTPFCLMEALNCLRQFCEGKKPTFRIPGLLLSSLSPILLRELQVSHYAPWMRDVSWWGGGHLKQREHSLHACRGQAATREQDGPDGASTLESRGRAKQNATPKLPQGTVPLRTVLNIVGFSSLSGEAGSQDFCVKFSEF